MRSDIVPGALFPDYELTDHTAKRRKELFYPYGKTYAQTLGEQD